MLVFFTFMPLGAMIGGLGGGFLFGLWAFRDSEIAIERFTRPDVHLMALYHPEFFPLPRFPLGISDVARAARTTLTGMITLSDMQLGTTLESTGLWPS